MYLLRWRYNFPTSVKTGIWSNPGNLDVDKAWFNYKSNLVSALIERKNFKTREIDSPFSCPGADFVMFQWIATAKLNPFNVKGLTTPLTRLVGIKMVTRYKIYEVYATGETRTLDHNGEYDSYNFAIYGK